MNRIVFCKVAWMKSYNNDPEDIMKNGGSYITENGTGMEKYNFLPINHYCYGYVMHQGNQLHIERFDKTLSNYSEVGDVTVVWVATDDGGSKIVGWYEHATMYRDWQIMSDPEADGGLRDYVFKAKEEDCFLILEENRTFEIPRAKDAPGKGMGQSQVWYADSEAAQQELIPKVLEYFEECRDDTISFFPREGYKMLAEDKGQSADQLLDEAEHLMDDPDTGIDPLFMLNLAISKEDSYRTRLRRAQYLCIFRLYEDAVEDYDKVFEYKAEADTLLTAMFVAEYGCRPDKVKEYAHRIIENHKDLDKAFWEDASLQIIYSFLIIKEPDEAMRLLITLENEKENYSFPFIEQAWQSVKIAKEKLGQ